VLVNTNFIWRFRVEKTLQVDEARNAAADVLNLMSKSFDKISIEISLNDRWRLGKTSKNRWIA
jgi:hypothetical protein